MIPINSLVKMNDTVHIWNDVWECAEKKDRKRDTVAVVVTMAGLLTVTALFYASSYIQGGGQTRTLIRCKYHFLFQFFSKISVLFDHYFSTPFKYYVECVSMELT